MRVLSIGMYSVRNQLTVGHYADPKRLSYLNPLLRQCLVFSDREVKAITGRASNCNVDNIVIVRELCPMCLENALKTAVTP